MSMLAEPRQRKRYNLVPRGKALYEDDNRFGTKMLEKMGWSKGKGLGANEDGSKEFVRVRYKNDANGFGYEDRDDQWTQHEESFNGLLKSLHDGEECANENDAEDVTTAAGFGFKSESIKKKLKEKFSGESLEEKSKKSKARVHYKKFTRGKDLSRYSEKDLANIFGKKDVEEQAANAVYDQFTAFKIDNENEKVVEEEKEVASNFAGVPTINTGLSVGEYFKQKMEAMKNKTKNSFQNDANKLIDVIEDENLECSQESGKRKKKKQKRVYNEEDEEATLPENASLKKKKRKQNDEEVSLLLKTEHFEEDVKNEHLTKKKKSKDEKRKAKTFKQNTTVEDMISNEEERGNANGKMMEETLQTKNDYESFAAENPKVKVERKISKTTPAENIALDKIVANVTAAKIIKKSTNKSEEMNESPNSKSLKTNEPTQHKEENMNDCATDKNEKMNFRINGHEISSSISSNTIKISSKEKTDAYDGSESVVEEELTLEALKTELNSYNVYSISTFCAEKFRNTDLACFVGSSLSAIVGYSLSDKLQLNIRTIKGDQERITKLWNGKMNKYENYSQQSNYWKYIKKAYTIKKTSKKVPRINIKSYKQKDAFTGF